MAVCERSKAKPSCPKHGKSLVFTTGRFGGFYCCEHYQNGCDITANKSKFDQHFHMTDQQTRDARKAAHEAFDRLWKDGGMKRFEAYKWLSRALGISGTQCHIQHFNVVQCDEVLKLLGGSTRKSAEIERIVAT